MGVFGNNISIEENLKNPNELLGFYILDEVSRLPEERIQEFCKSEQAEALVEAGIIGRKTLVRLSKDHDLVRREKMAAFQLAKEANDPLWIKLVKNRIIERKLIAAIVKKYGIKAQRTAKIGQKDYLKNRLTLGFMRK